MLLARLRLPVVTRASTYHLRILTLRARYLRMRRVVYQIDDILIHTRLRCNA
jgi:hypothetical protein